MKITRERISDFIRMKETLEENITETAMDRAKLEQKIMQTKQGHVKESAKIESDLKSEFEQKKIELEQLQEQVTKIRKQFH